MNDNYANIYLFSTQKYAKKYLLYPKNILIEENTYFLRFCRRNPDDCKLHSPWYLSIASECE